MKPEDVKLLVVDDDKDLCQSMSHYFEVFGYQTEMAFGGEEALSLAEKNEYHLIITDLRMPKVNGVQLIQTLRSKNSKSPRIYVVTGFSEIPIEMLYQVGADGYFAKPFDSRTMMDAIRKATLPLSEIWKRPPSLASVKEVVLKSTLTENLIKIGRGGISFKYRPQNNWSVGDHLILNIDISSNDEINKIEGEGLVRWMKLNSNGELISGVELTYVNDGCRDQLIKYIETYSGIPFIPQLD